MSFLHAYRSLALAYLGRKAEALQEGERGAELLPMSRDALWGPPIQHHLVRIFPLVGEPEQALDRLEPLLTVKYYFPPGWPRIDPTFAPLRSNRRFERWWRVSSVVPDVARERLRGHRLGVPLKNPDPVGEEPRPLPGKVWRHPSPALGGACHYRFL